jgi:hypothetical protein
MPSSWVCCGLGLLLLCNTLFGMWWKQRLRLRRTFDKVKQLQGPLCVQLTPSSCVCCGLGLLLLLEGVLLGCGGSSVAWCSSCRDCCLLS